MSGGDDHECSEEVTSACNAIITQTAAGSDIVGKDVLESIDKLRGLIKRGVSVAPLASKSLLSSLLRVAELVSLHKHESHLSETAIRCLMNIIYQDTSLHANEHFKSIHGTSLLFDLIQQEIPVRIAYYSIKLLYMIFSFDRDNALHILTLKSKLAPLSFSEVIVATYMNSLKPNATADRCDLFIECTKLLYAIEHTYQKAFSGLGPFKREDLPGLSDMERTLHTVQTNVIEVMLQSSRNKHIHACKLASLQLILLADNKALQKLCLVEQIIGNILTITTDYLTLLETWSYYMIFYRRLVRSA
jgi:hypothetical protein